MGKLVTNYKKLVEILIRNHKQIPAELQGPPVGGVPQSAAFLQTKLTYIALSLFIIQLTSLPSVLNLDELGFDINAPDYMPNLLQQILLMVLNCCNSAESAAVALNHLEIILYVQNDVMIIAYKIRSSAAGCK
ncbi:hypothetical protein niasHS_017280 [Heterodera schachtii]|uniref:Uncharacterized protein n=1 Tax=Heterodera schachtii TaxID=97005 RepID=A0ABD2HTW6_HETSC